MDTDTDRRPAFPPPHTVDKTKAAMEVEVVDMVEEVETNEALEGRICAKSTGAHRR